jgi:CRP/FNR family cyclic AMP-dependent transcriptional regulator
MHSALAHLPLLSGLSRRRLRRLARDARFVEYAPRDFIVQAGEAADELHVILSGRARVIGKPHARVLERGDYFGELALLDGGVRSATIVAGTEVHALVIPHYALIELLEDEPQVAKAMLTDLSSKLRRLEQAA